MMAATVPSADGTLILAALAGDELAREKLALRLECIPRMVGVLARDMGRPLAADELGDLSQDVLLLVWRKIGSFAGESRLETWLYSFCYRELMNFLRGRARRPRLIGDASLEAVAPPIVAVPRTEDGELAEFLRHLSQREAEVVRLRYVEALELKEIAGVLGVSTSTVKTSYYRALDKLRDVVEPPAEEAS